MKSASKFKREQFWRNHIQRQKTQGCGISSYCRWEGLSPYTFRYWQKKFEGQVQTRAFPAFVPVEVMPEIAQSRQLPDPKWLAELILNLGGAR